MVLKLQLKTNLWYWRQPGIVCGSLGQSRNIFMAGKIKYIILQLIKVQKVICINNQNFLSQSEIANYSVWHTGCDYFHWYNYIQILGSREAFLLNPEQQNLPNVYTYTKLYLQYSHIIIFAIPLYLIFREDEGRSYKFCPRDKLNCF